MNTDPTGLQDGWDCDDDSCDVWLSWDWSDEGWYGWDGLDWGWGADPSYLTPNLTGNGGAWWFTQNNVAAANFIASLATTSTYTIPTGSIVNAEPQIVIIHGGTVCIKYCEGESNAGETAEQKSQRYLTNFMMTIGSVAGMFDGGMFEPEVVTPFMHPDIIKTEAKFTPMTESLTNDDIVGFHDFRQSPPTPLGKYSWAKRAGLSAKEEAKYTAAQGDSWYHDFITGEIRTSDHWGQFKGSTYTLDLTDEQMIQMGGYKVPASWGEPNLWLFKKPISGYVLYKDMIIKSIKAPLWP